MCPTVETEICVISNRYTNSQTTHGVISCVICLFQGQNLDRGCGKDDYNVTFGRGHCNVTELVSNQLLCLTPEAPPSAIDDQSHLGTDKYYCQVSSMNYIILLVRLP